MSGLRTTCNTTGGPFNWDSGWKCQFPFQYNGKVFNECIDGENNGESFSWCSTKVEGENRVHVKKNWGYCSPECSCTTVGGPKDSWKIGDRCQFPFMYNGVEYNGCVEYDLKQHKARNSHEKGAWCSTEVHKQNRSHIHRRWGKCSLGCPIETSIKKSTCNQTEHATKTCKECQFPFVLKTNGSKIHNCISVSKHKQLQNSGYWCPTQLDGHMLPVRRKWVLCDKNCTGFNLSEVMFQKSEYSSHFIDEISDYNSMNVVSTEAFAITATSFLFLFAAVLGLLMWNRKRKKVNKKKREMEDQSSSQSRPSSISTDSTDVGSFDNTPILPEPPFLPPERKKSYVPPFPGEEYVPMLPNTLTLIHKKLFSCNRNKEINRRSFTLGMLIGNGHFGKVFKGIVTGLEHPQSKTCVAVKTANDPNNKDEILSLVCEAEIMSNLSRHLNLVNLIAFCSSHFSHTGELWLLLEYCNEGDMKSYLRKIYQDIRRNETDVIAKTNSNSRTFLTWAYDIAKGMEYLSKNSIMHGDLAARNILLSIQNCGNESKLVAKIADFGLAKHFRDNMTYTKALRKYLPWKWMAIEYLENGSFTLSSDVWSFGVVLWEIFAYGKEPYPGRSIEDVVSRLKRGIYLQFPDEMQPTSWPAKDFYSKIATNCFAIHPNQRTNFTHLINMIEKELNQEEKVKYLALITQYNNPGNISEKSTTWNFTQGGLFPEESITNSKGAINKTSFLTSSGYSRFPGFTS